MTSATETLLRAALRKTTRDHTRALMPSSLEQAHIDLLRAGLQWFDNYAEDPLVYEDGRVAGADRMYKISPEGRATIALAHALLGDEN